MLALTPPRIGLVLQYLKDQPTKEKKKKKKKLCFFLVKRVPGRGLELSEPNKAVLCPLIIIILITFYYILLLNY